MPPTISVATHSKPQCQMSCIDNILVNKAENVKATGVIKTHISHHRSLFLSFQYLSTKHTPTRSKTNDIKYDFSKQNLHHMSNLLINNLNSQPKNFAEFSKRFIDCKRNCGSPSKRNRLENPWITTALINSISKRDRLYKKWKQTKSKLCTSGDPRLFEEYRKYRNSLSNLIKRSKQNFYTKKFENASGNLKQTWALINQLRGKCKSSIICHLTINKCTVLDNKVIANKFNSY